MANRLQFEHSPYLLQHKNNPVDWYAWGAEAFDRAKKEDKPILLSIGYATCHWCHVMAHESFEDDRIAAIMNELFINIKLDREELPAVDHYYMDAVQLLTGRGGWPLNCFLTPDKKPFLGGTYFPPEDRGQQVSWRRVILHVGKVFQRQREQVEEQAERIHQRIENLQTQGFKPLIQWEEGTNRFDLKEIIESTRRNWDIEFGGMKGAPKFPMAHVYSSLLSWGLIRDEAEIINFVHRTAHAFIQGGLYDPVRGGFARYCVDAQWRVPHFEKMLYDNAGILSLLAVLNRFQDDPSLKWALESTLHFLKNYMRDQDQLFFSAVDADSEGEEGKYYTWSYPELEQVLDESELEIMKAYFDIEKGGNWEGTNVLYSNLAQYKIFSKKYRLDDLDAVLAKLNRVAAHRTPPEIDNKKLVDWNALLAHSLLLVARYQKNGLAAEMGIATVNQLLDEFVSSSGALKYHAKKEDVGYGEPTLDDYSFLIQACLSAYIYTFEIKYLDSAQLALEHAIEAFSTPHAALFYSLASGSEQLDYRPIAFYDTPYPSGNAVMCKNLYNLGKYTGQTDWTQHAEKMLHQVQDKIERSPTALGAWLDVIIQVQEQNHEIAIIGPRAKNWGRKIANKTLPGTVLMAQATADDSKPLLNRSIPSGKTQIFLCENYACQLPLDDLEAFWNAYGNTNPILNEG